MHVIMMDFIIWGRLTRPQGPFRAQGFSLTRNVASPGGRGGTILAPIPEANLATLRVSGAKHSPPGSMGPPDCLEGVHPVCGPGDPLAFVI